MATARTTADEQDVAAAKAHSATVRVEFSELVAFLREQLGTAALAIIAGVDPKTTRRWTDPGKLPRDADIERRVRTAYQVFQLIQTVEAPPTVRAWFLGSNPQLSDHAPVEALADGREREVLSAARSFVAGG